MKCESQHACVQWSVSHWSVFCFTARLGIPGESGSAVPTSPAAPAAPWLGGEAGQPGQDLLRQPREPHHAVAQTHYPVTTHYSNIHEIKNTAKKKKY